MKLNIETAAIASGVSNRPARPDAMYGIPAALSSSAIDSPLLLARVRTAKSDQLSPRGSASGVSLKGVPLRSRIFFTIQRASSRGEAKARARRSPRS